MQLVAFINMAHLLCHYCLLILPTAVLAMAVRDGAFGAEYGPVLELATAMFVLYGLLSLPQGWLAARFGRRAMIAAYFFGTGAALVAASLTRTPLALELALAAAGAFAAIYHPVGTAMLVEAAGDRPGRALGTNGVCGNVGVALAPVVTAALASRFGWPVAFAAPGLVFVALGVAWLRLPAAGPATSGAIRPFAAIP
ncbi:MAG: MFS transporter, partial [Janthinobacterium lividum]